MRTQAVILKKIPIRESDELVICYTKDAGKQVYQAKSILSPTSKQVGHLDVLNLVDFSLVTPKNFVSGQGKNSHPIIASAYCLNSFRYLKSSLPAMAVAYFLLECFDKLIFEGEPDIKLWDFLIGQLRNLDTQQVVRGSTSNNDLPRPALGNRGRASDWPGLISDTSQELLKILGYNESMPIEQLANSHFNSLQFARSMVK